MQLFRVYDSDHQSEKDCPIIAVPVKREPGVPIPQVTTDYDFDEEIKSDDEPAPISVDGIPEKSNTGGLPETPRKKKKKKEKKVFTLEESDRILKAMHTKAYEQDTDAVKGYRVEQGITIASSTNVDNHSGFLQWIRQTQGSLPEQLKTVVKSPRRQRTTPKIMN